MVGVILLNKMLLLLGASRDQLYAIKTAHEMGIKVIVVDMNPNSIGFKYADDYRVISTRDVSALTKFIVEYQKVKKIDGVITMGSEIPDIIAELCYQFGWVGPSKQTAYWGINKYAMKYRFKECGIPIPYFSLVNSVKQLKEIINKIGYPVVIKPVDRSGSRGVYKIEESDDICALYNESKKFSYSNQIMVEEYLEGLQISTETVLYDNKAETPGFADRNYELLNRFAPRIIENGGTVPSSLSEREQKRVKSLVVNAARALGVKRGIAKGDVVMTNKGLYVIEMAVRLSGGDFSESLIPLGCGVNIVKAAINIALGEKPNFSELKPKFNKGVVNRYLFPEEGVFKSASNLDLVKKKKWLKKLEFFYNIGDEYRNPTSHANRFGVFIVTGGAREEAIERSKWVYNTLKINMETLHYDLG
ncbi:MAG: ATP-grasp domain-containing protein [Candidatus Atribacteria bacterium]|nr:ATP-grasp domain-containing protein [Candidatus Atribacteria bacterium]